MSTLIIGAILSVSPPTTMAGPEGAQVVNGQVSFQQSGYNTTITASDKAIINYSSFDIAKPEIVEFMQPSSQASVLNRINSAMPTNIEGTLRANGRVFFVNPAGVYIGEGAHINVNQLVASGLNISDMDFINGRMNFVGGDGTVTNQGEIIAEKAYLIGKNVINSGNISCPGGYVMMAAGERVFLREQDSDILVELDNPTLPEPPIEEPGLGVHNEAAATESKITLAAGDIYSQAISNIDSLATSIEICNAGQVSNTGTIEAKSETASGGTVIAKAAEVINSGTIDVTGSRGGEVTIEAMGRLGQLGIIHADGTTGNGGNIELKADNAAALSPDSLTTANAGTDGDGGEVVVYSPDTALFHDGAKMEAKGGTESGAGGFVEVSGKKHTEVFGWVDASAEAGEPGTFLIDPINITIQNNVGAMDPGPDGTFTPSCNASTVSDDAIEEWLNKGTNVQITAGSTGDTQGNITQEAEAPIDKTSGGDATIKLTGGDITLDGGIVSESGKLGVILDSDGDVILRADITTNGGDFISSGSEFDNTDGPINTIGGVVKIEYSGEVKVGRIDASDGNVAISAGTICEGVSDTEVDIEGSVIDLEAQKGAIGPLQVVASNQLNAKTLKDSSDIIISCPMELQSSCNPLEMRDLVIGVIDSAGAIDIKAAGGITVAGGEGVEISAKTKINLHSGASGIGDLSFQPKATLQAPEISLRAGNGVDVPDTDIVYREAKIDDIQHLELNYTSIAPDTKRSLTIRQDASIDDIPSKIELPPDEAGRVDLILKSDDGYITCTSADEWNSIEATALNDIRLEGSGCITTNSLRSRTGNISVHSTGGDVVVNGEVDAFWRPWPETEILSDDKEDVDRLWEVFDYLEDHLPGGGVELLADAGRIYSNGADTLNVAIQGYSDDARQEEAPVGVNLSWDGGKAAIVISSQESLHLGPCAELTTQRRMRPGDPVKRSGTDDRGGVDFVSGPSTYDQAGDPIDVSVYLRSKGGEVAVDCPVQINDYGGGAMVVDASGKVEFGGGFAESWLNQGFPRLEVVSRTTQNLLQGAANETLPGAREMFYGKIPIWILEAADQQIASGNEPGKNASDVHWSKYVLRGGTPGQVLAFAELAVGPPGQWFDIAKATRSIAALVREWHERNRERLASEQAKQMWDAHKGPELPLRDHVASSPKSNGIFHNGEWRSVGFTEPTPLRKGDLVLVRGDGISFVKFNKDIDIIIEAGHSAEIVIQARGVRLLAGKIWFWTTETDSDDIFEIRTDGGVSIEITGATKGSVSVSQAKEGVAVTVGPILTGQVEMYGPYIPTQDVGAGWWVIPEGKNLKPVKIPESILSQAKKEFKRIEETPQKLTFRELKSGPFPYLILTNAADQFTFGHGDKTRR